MHYLFRPDPNNIQTFIFMLNVSEERKREKRGLGIRIMRENNG
jgi:hypothetical protein